MTLGKDRVVRHSGETVQKGKRNMKRIWLNLRLFEGEGGAGSAVSAAGMAGGLPGGQSAPGSAASQGTAPQPQQGTAGGEGEPEAGTQKGSAEPTEEERKAQYSRFKEDFKDLYSQDVQKVVNRRYKENEQLRKQLDSYDPLLNMLSSKYGVEGTDVQAIMDALDKDNSFWEEAALKENMSVDQYKKMQKYESEHKQLVEAARRAEQNRQREETYARWDREAEACRQRYPQFDMEIELNNPQFVRLLGAGLEVEAAYRACHFEELARGIAAQTAQDTKKKVADNIRSGQGRPAENGVGTGAANSAKINVMELSKEEFRKLVDRVKRGEVVTL